MTNQPPKDFLALSHGHEWVNFYESFDNLVQDHLSRSSELLRKAMSLPEVADREVAQIRDDLEARLTTQRDRNSATLTSLKQEIASSKVQASSVVGMVAALIGDLDRLSSNVEMALVRAAEEAIVAKPDVEVDEADELVADIYSSAELADKPLDPAGLDVPADAELSWESLTNEANLAATDGDDSDVEADEAPESEIDLTALAAMEEDLTLPDSQEIEMESEETAATIDENESAPGNADTTERTRPHWLSMARTSSGQ